MCLAASAQLPPAGHLRVQYSQPWASRSFVRIVASGGCCSSSLCRLQHSLHLATRRKCALTLPPLTARLSVCYFVLAGERASCGGLAQVSRVPSSSRGRFLPCRHTRGSSKQRAATPHPHPQTLRQTHHSHEQTLSDRDATTIITLSLSLTVEASEQHDFK